MFLKDATVALLVYDITNQKTYLEIKVLNIFQENGSKKMIMYLFGNKYDLSEKRL